MTRLRKSFIHSVAFMICAITLSMFFGIYSPLRTELKKSEEENFLTTTKITYTTVNSYAESLKKMAESVSNRLIIKNEIINYRKGSTSFAKLHEFTSDKYEYALHELNELIDSARVVDNEYLIPFDNIEQELSAILLDATTTEIEFIMLETTVTARVISPISNTSEIIGHDIMFFELENLLKEINGGSVRYSLLAADEQKKHFKNSNEKTYNNISLEKLIRDGNQTYYIIPMTSISGALLCRIDNDILYESVKKIKFSSIIFISAILIFAITFSNLTVIKKSNSLIDELEKQRKKYRELAMKDPLTGIWNRSFFNEWLKNFLPFAERNGIISSMVVIDIDNFKMINDSFGHITGDRVLKFVAGVLDTSLRESDQVGRFKVKILDDNEETDMVVRFGGDEFVMFLPDCDNTDAKLVMKRVSSEIDRLQKFPFSVKISYGISKISSAKEITKAIHDADREMYKMKQGK